MAKSSLKNKILYIHIIYIELSQIPTHLYLISSVTLMQYYYIKVQQFKM